MELLQAPEQGQQEPQTQAQQATAQEGVQIMLHLAVDVPAYATLEVPAGISLERQALAEFVRQAVQQQEAQDPGSNGMGYEPDYYATPTGLRVICATAKNPRAMRSAGINLNALENILIENAPHDAGVAVTEWQSGLITWDQFLNEVQLSKGELNSTPEMKTFEAKLTMRGNATARVTYSVRAGATQQERDIAALQAWANETASQCAVRIEHHELRQEAMT